MPLTPVQIVRVAAVRHNDEILTNDERLRLIADAQTSEELHRFVLGAPESLAETSRLAAIVRHPQCARGTALLVYWALNPGTLYWLLKKRRKFSAQSEEIWTVLMMIEERMRARRYTGDPIAFSLSQFLGHSLEEEARTNPGSLSVPDFMRTDVVGSWIE